MEKKEERIKYYTDGVVMYAHDSKTGKNLEFSEGVWEETDLDVVGYYRDNKKDCLKVSEKEALIMTGADPREVLDGRALEDIDLDLN